MIICKWLTGFITVVAALLFLNACGGQAADSSQAAATTVPAATAALASDSAAGNAAAVEGAQRFVVVPEESTASYVVSEEFFGGALAKYGIEAGFNEVIGSTQEVAGELQLDLAKLPNALVSGVFTVDLPSLTTDRNQRDSWIRDNALESNNFPIARFVATEMQNAPTTYSEGSEINFQLVGDLTVRDITQSVTFSVTATLNGDTLSGVATTEKQLTDFGFEPPSFVNTLTVNNDFVIRIELTARAQ